jgi:hypothetical protein
MSSGDAPSLALPDNHHRRVASAVHTFLETIEDIEKALALPPADGPLVLFDNDIPGDMAERLGLQLEDLRFQVAELARASGVTMRPLSARRRVSSAASYAWTVAEELTPRKLTSSGEIDAEAAAAIGERASRLARCFLNLAREVDAAGASADGLEATSR